MLESLWLMYWYRGETLVSDLRDCINHVRSEQTRINNKFEKKYEQLTEERNKANEEWMAERRRVNAVRDSLFYNMDLRLGLWHRSMQNKLSE